MTNSENVKLPYRSRNAIYSAQNGAWCQPSSDINSTCNLSISPMHLKIPGGSDQTLAPVGAVKCPSLWTFAAPLVRRISTFNGLLLKSWRWKTPVSLSVRPRTYLVGLQIPPTHQIQNFLWPSVLKSELACIIWMLLVSVGIGSLGLSVCHKFELPKSLDQKLVHVELVLTKTCLSL